MSRWVNYADSYGLQYQALQVPVISGPTYGPPEVWDGVGSVRVSSYAPSFVPQGVGPLGDFRDETYIGVTGGRFWTGWYLVEKVTVPAGYTYASPRARWLQYSNGVGAGEALRFGMSTPADDGILNGKNEDPHWANWGIGAWTNRDAPQELDVGAPADDLVAADAKAAAVTTGVAQIGAAIEIYAAVTLQIVDFWMEFRYPLPEDGALPW